MLYNSDMENDYRVMFNTWCCTTVIGRMTMGSVQHVHTWRTIWNEWCTWPRQLRYLWADCELLHIVVVSYTACRVYNYATVRDIHLFFLNTRPLCELSVTVTVKHNHPFLFSSKSPPLFVVVVVVVENKLVGTFSPVSHRGLYQG